jgi:hypothetical protein
MELLILLVLLLALDLAVSRWWPRRHPWQPGQANQPARHER